MNDGRKARLAALKDSYSVGDRWYRLTVVEVRGRWYTMRCDCGTERQVRHCHLPALSSCGCRVQRRVESPVQSHPHYGRWANIKSRCFNPKFPHYKNYGGRGITMHPLWANDFLAFAAAIGDPPSPRHELDRIDNDGNYEPGNLRWVMRTANQRNKRRACAVVVGDRKIPLAVVAARFSLDYFCLHGAYRRGNDKALAYLNKKGISEDQLRSLAASEDFYAPEAIAVDRMFTG